MIQQDRLIFIHGLYGTSQGEKAILLKGLFPGMLIPDFPGSLEERMEQLEEILSDKDSWTIIGSSFGGLMAALYARRHPDRVRRLVLLAPALTLPDFVSGPQHTIDIPTLVYSGERDNLIPTEDLRPIVEAAFTDLSFITVEDEHGLYKTAAEIDWEEILSS
jgi:pimeloyl-ACP methyl ester carboxylesterase